MNDQISSISEIDVQDWVDPTSFKRGRAYFRQGSIFQPRRQGRKIMANCRGTSAPSYRVEVSLGLDEIE